MSAPVDSASPTADVELVQRMQIRRMQNATRSYDSVRIFIGGKWYCSDVVSQRDIGLAEHLALSHGVPIEADEQNAPRVRGGAE